MVIGAAVIGVLAAGCGDAGGSGAFQDVTADLVEIRVRVEALIRERDYLRDEVAFLRMACLDGRAAGDAR